MSLERLKQAVADSSITIVANRIGVPRCTLSLVVRDKYPASPAAILKKFELASDTVNCPFAKRELTRTDCKNRHTAPRPFSGAAKTAWWEACQTCDQK